MPAALRTVRRLGRDRVLLRVVASYALFSVTEYAVWIAVLVYAYGQGGATAAGVVAFAELLPAAVVAPFVSAAGDRFSPSRVLLLGYLAQGVGVVALSVTYYAHGSPYAIYGAAIVVSTAVSSTRPALAAVVPALTREVDGLTAANAVLGWLEAVSIVVAGAGTGAALAVGSVGDVFVGCAALLVMAATLVSSLSVPAIATAEDISSVVGDVRAGIVAIRRSREAGVLVGLLGAEFVVLGALDVLFVVLAFDVLDEGAAWAGYLNMAYGIGGVVLGSLAALLIGRRLGPVVAMTALVLGLSLGATALAAGPYAVAALLGVVGGCRALYDVATRTLLQRAVPAQMVARIFGLAEGVGMAGLAVGSLLAPLLVAIGGSMLAVIGVAAVLPLAVLATSRVVARLDAESRVPLVQIALLRSVSLFRDLPAPALEGVARALRRVDVGSGATIIREGDPGDDYYAIADGDVEVQIDGRRVRTMRRGSGVGELALLRSVPRTATVIALTPVTLFALDREAFLTAVNAHVPTQRNAAVIVRAHLADPEAP